MKIIGMFAGAAALFVLVSPQAARVVGSAMHVYGNMVDWFYAEVNYLWRRGGTLIARDWRTHAEMYNLPIGSGSLPNSTHRYETDPGLEGHPCSR